MPTAPGVAEVIASSTRELVAQVHRDAEAPAFGSWVTVAHPGGTRLYALVSHVELGSIEPGRQAVALGMDEEALRREMPHVLHLLRTTVREQVLAYDDAAGVLRQTLPPQPAPLHAFVHACSPEAVRRLGAPYDFLRTLARHPDPAVPADDLLVAVLDQAARAAGADGGAAAARAALLEAGRVLTRLLNDDHERLQSILRRVAS